MEATRTNKSSSATVNVTSAMGRERDEFGATYISRADFDGEFQRWYISRVDGVLVAVNPDAQWHPVHEMYTLFHYEEMVFAGETRPTR